LPDKLFDFENKNFTSFFQIELVESLHSIKLIVLESSKSYLLVRNFIFYLL